ncbi:hypothetical protein [Allokutzneria albata]|uniref:Uncharacterized protein n=1 Tax=Allokutzneria albata TaxID=211114 RepID=A0A1H0DS93_ALLAB|nr:hypothetical protein [Allokutzneria albata]SDN72916.1 hypothetical protein SAMN04489726_7959 [Allokutzneria albata]
MATRLSDNRLIQRLRDFDLDPDEFVIFGSGPLLAHGLRDDVPDLDIVACGEVWRRVSACGFPATGDITGDRVWTFWNGRLQFSNRWISEEWDTRSLIDRADVIEGLRFAPLPDVLRYKKVLGRPKDSVDIRKLMDRLGDHGSEVA